jgi:hypothetical protein
VNGIATAILAHQIMFQKFGLVMKDYVSAAKSGGHDEEAFQLMLRHAKTLDQRKNSAAEISPHARDMWQWAANGNPSASMIAENETLSEMARLELQTGEAPGSDEWQALYRDVNKYWEANA